MLEQKIKYKNKDGYHVGYGWCGNRCRWATRDKINAINKFKSSLKDDIIDYIGIAADEISRFEYNNRPGKRLPLVEWGMTEQDCLDYCHNAGYFWIEKSNATPSHEVSVELYDVLDRVSCWCCQNKNLSELRNIYKYLPQYWQRLKELQGRIEEPMKGPGASVHQLELRYDLEDRRIAEGKKNNTRDFYAELKRIIETGR